MTRLYLATDRGPIVVSGEGRRWRAARPQELTGEVSASCVAADPSQPERVFLGTDTQGLWRSDNAGRDWMQVLENNGWERVTSVAVSPCERVGRWGVVYAGTEPSAVLRSEDGGETWHECPGLTDLPSSKNWSFPPRPETHHARVIGPDPHQAGLIFVAIEAGALVSSPDGGATWRDRVPGGPIDTHQLVAHPAAPGRLWSAAGDGFFESGDGGRTWRKSEQGLRFRYCWSVAVDPADPGTAVLSSSPGPRQAHALEYAESALYRRTGEGAWQNISSRLAGSKGVRAQILAASPAEPGVFYAAGDGGIYRSGDAGASWQSLECAWPDGEDPGRIHGLAAVRLES